MRKPILTLLAVLLAVTGTVGADVRYEEETKMEGMMKIATMGKGMKTKTLIRGDRMRTETNNEATIIDLEAEKIYTLDTKKKTYTEMTFEEMKRQMASAMSSAQRKQGEGGKESPNVSATADVTVTKTDRAEEIKGYPCEQYLMELDVEMTSEDREQSGSFSTVTEMWLTKDVPGLEEVRAFYMKMAEKLGTTALGQQMMAGGGGSDESQKFGASMAKMMEEMRKMDGFTVRSTMYVGDPEAAKKEASGEKSGGGGFGGLGGMLKKMGPLGGSESGDSSRGGAPAGMVLMKLTTELKKIESKELDPKHFSVPENYERREAR